MYPTVQPIVVHLVFSKDSPGRPTKFTADEEKTMEDLLLNCAKIGVPLSIQLFYKVVDQISLDKGK